MNGKTWEALAESVIVRDPKLFADANWFRKPGQRFAGEIVPEVRDASGR